MKKINVLFMQSQSYFGSDSMIHSLLMRYLDRSKFDVHVAVNAGTRESPSASFKALQAIPDLQLRPTSFGPSVYSRSRLAVAKEAVTGGLPSAASLSGLAKYIRDHQIKLIHGTEKPRDAFIGLLLARTTGAKCVIQVHVKAENWISPLVRWSMKHADALVGVSAFVGGSLIDMGYPARKVHPVLNSIEAKEWPAEIDGSPIRREFGIPADSPVLAIISRLFYWKGHTELIKALALIKAHAPDMRLLVVGEDDPRGMPGRGSYTAELKTLVHNLGLTEQVLFTGFRRDIRQILAACDIFTMPSFEEPCAVAYLEAMAMKKPVVALDNGGTRELIENGKSGLLSSPQDIDQLAKNILTLIQDPGLRLKMGEYGRRRVEEYFNPIRMACDVEAVYQELIEQA